MFNWVNCNKTMHYSFSQMELLKKKRKKKLSLLFKRNKKHQPHQASFHFSHFRMESIQACACVSNHCIYIATDALWAAKSLVADLHRTQWKTENMLQCNWLDKSVQNSLFWLLTINVGIHRKERKRQWWYN